jgi:hypothetical protein
MDVSVLFRSSVQIAHISYKPSHCRCNRNLTIAACARHFRREVIWPKFCIIFFPFSPRRRRRRRRPASDSLFILFLLNLQSLFSKGTKQPEDVVQRCLTHFRKCDLPSLSQYLPLEVQNLINLDGSNNKNNPPVLLVGNIQVHEQVPLALLQPILDIGARRVLPGHLLRRSRVLATLRLAPTEFQQRIALTAQTGEESIFTWQLSWREGEDGDKDNSSASVEGHWVIRKVEREHEGQQGKESGRGERTSEESRSSNNGLPTTPQPKSSPESVVYAQLEALRRGDVYEASQFNIWRQLSVTSISKETDEQNRILNAQPSSFSLGLQYELLRDTLRDSSYTALVNHRSAVFGAAALPTQRSMLQEVWVKSSGGASASATGSRSRAAGDWVRFVWNLSLESSNGCWMCTQIEPYLDT